MNRISQVISNINKSMVSKGTQSIVTRGAKKRPLNTKKAPNLMRHGGTGIRGTWGPKGNFTLCVYVYLFSILHHHNQNSYS